MSDVCLRNMSCKCRLCAGEDVSMLLNITKSISSNITYTDDDGVDSSMINAPSQSSVTNSPPVPSMARNNATISQRKPFPSHRVGNTKSNPPLSFEREEPMEVVMSEDDAMMEDVPMTSTIPPHVTVNDVAMESDGTEEMNIDMTPSTPLEIPVMPPPVPISTSAPVTSTTSELSSIEQIHAKLVDKNWKIRKQAYEQVITWCERPGTRHEAVASLVEMFAKMCDDANASAMEAAFQAVLAYTQHVEPFYKGMVPSVMTRLVDKGLASRPATVKICEDLVIALIEAGAVEETIGALMEGTKNKKPKVPPLCVSCVLEALKSFGPRVIPIQILKANLPSLCESTTNGVRPIALNIIAEIHRWTGPALIQDIVSNLRQAQQVEYETLTKDIIVGQAQPTKVVRGAKRSSTVMSTNSKSASTSRPNDSTAAFDPREFAETVNLLDKLAKSEFRTKLASPKWSEKVEALKIALSIIGPVPKLAMNADYYELMTTLKLLSNDANVNIVAKSIEVMGALCDGLRKAFTPHARMIYPDLVRKLSDKKSVILNAVNTTLDLFLQHSMTVDMMMDEIKMGMDPSKNKTPQARVQVISFLVRSIEKKMPVVVSEKTVVIEFGTLFVNGLDDVDPTVRKAATEALITLVKVMTELQTSHFVQGLMDDVTRRNPRAFKSIQQGLGQVTGTGSAASSRPSSAGSTGPPASTEIPDVEMETPASAPVSRKASIVQKPAVRSSLVSSRASGANKAPVSQPTRKSAPAISHSTTATDFVPFSISVVPEEVESILMEVPIDSLSEIQNGLSSSKWMERKQALERFETFAQLHPNALTVRVIEALTLFISIHVKQFKDSNIMVLRSAFQAIGTFAVHVAGKFPRGVVCAVVPNALDKIGDKKASETIRTMVLQFAEATNPTYVLGCIVQHMETVKTPLAHIEVLTVISDAIRDFGVSVCSPRMIIDYVKGNCGLESSNVKVRTGAIAVLASMYAQLGPSLLPILDLSSWKPALASTVEAEFKKTGYDPSLASGKRQVRDEEGNGKTRSDPTALFGRVDISTQLTKELMNDLKCEEDKAAWKKRLAAMDSIQSICEGAGCAIEFTKTIMELLKLLKGRLSDSNANLKVRAAQIIGLVATSVGPEIGKMSKLLGPSILSGVSDNKKNMQIASIEALHKWVRHGNKTSSACVESLISSISEGLMNPVGRAELLGWLAEHLRACDRVLDLNSLVAPTIQCLMDKSSEAREKAQLVLGEVMKSVGKDYVLSNGCRDIKPAQMRTLRPLIDKAYELGTADNPPSSTMSATLSISVPLPPPSDARLARTNSMPNKTATTATTASNRSLARTSSVTFRNDASNAITLESVPPPSASGNGEPSPTGAMLKMNTNKPSRLAKGQFNKWIFDSTSPTELANRKNELEIEWRPYLTTEFHGKLFAATLEKGMMSALSDLLICISTQPQEVLAALDLIFKWCTLRMVDNNVQALAKLLEVLVSLFEFLKSLGYQLDDVEASILLPYLLQESGQSKPRFRVRFRDIMRLVVTVYSTESYVTYLLDCCNTSKNMKSRCECIDTMEYMIKTHGFQAVGKRCVKEIGKFVLVHEKDVRESAINALMAVYLRTDGNLDRFFRFTGVTSTQGMDLLTARIKHLPATSVPDGSAISTSVSARTPPRTIPTVGNSVTSEQKTFNNTTTSQCYGKEDVHMATPNKGLERVQDPLQEESETIENFLFRPIEALLTETREIVSETTSQYADGVDSLKGLYTILYEPNGEAEVSFIKYHVNDMVIRLCDCIHGALGHGADSSKPIPMVVLTLSLSALHQLLQCSPAVESIQRYAVERILLEISNKLLDPRFEDLATQSGNLTSLLNEADTMAIEKRRLLYIYKALTTIMTATVKRIKAGELFPSVINLLQRIVRNDVGEYNARDSYNHLMKKDSLDQLVGRLLLKISTSQANTTLNAFEGVDIFGILMQMHSFFSTLPHNDLFAVQIANENMQRALKIIADSLIKVRPTSFEASVNDLPLNSPVRELLTQLGHSTTSTRLGLPSSEVGLLSSSTIGSSNLSSIETSSTDNITRRLFDAGSTQSTSTTASLNRFGGGSFRYNSKTTEAPTEKTQNVKELRVRLAAVRKFTDEKKQDGSM